MNAKAKKSPKMNKIAHISVYDNRKSDFSEKAKAYSFSYIFNWNFQNQFIIALGPYLSARIVELGFFLIGGKIQNLAANFFKCLTQKYGPINKVPEQLYIDSEIFK